jgi:hypothetical protein
MRTIGALRSWFERGKQAELDCHMESQNNQIDQIHSRAICSEIADRLRISLSQDLSPLPTFLKLRLDQLRESEEDSPSIVPSMRADDF